MLKESQDPRVGDVIRVSTIQREIVMLGHRLVWYRERGKGHVDYHASKAGWYLWAKHGRLIKRGEE